MKKILWLVVALCLFACGALAEESGSIASFVLPEGAETYYLPDNPDIPVPDGLAELYALMRNFSPNSDVYLARMPHGRVLASVSCKAVPTPFTAQQLHALWPEIASRIGKTVQYINADAACAKAETRYGFEALAIETDLAVGTDSMLLLKAHSTAFCRGTDLLEVWAVYPADSVYLYDEAAAAELAADLNDLNAFLASLNFAGEPVAEAAAAPYRAPSGRFAMAVPRDCVILDPTSTQQAAADVRARYIAANPDGADTAFDVYYRDLLNEDATLIFTADMQAVVALYCLSMPEADGLTPDMLCRTAGSTRDGLTKKFGAARCLLDNGRQELSGITHARMGYALSTRDFAQELLLLCCVESGGWLREVDLFFSEAMPGRERLALVNLVLQTLTYRPAQ